MNEHSALMGQIDSLLAQSSRILMITHVAPDGDAIGSLLGLGSLLRAQGKELTLACEDTVPYNCAWLPGSDKVVQQAHGSYDLVISLDCSDRRRMGAVYRDDLDALPLLNIDHHVTNTDFGTLNWVDPVSVSTTQMVFNLANDLGWSLTQPVATCLLSGLVTDTRSFRTSNVDAAAMQAALRLMEVGASLADISRRMLDQRPVASIRLWAQAIRDMCLDDGILWATITRDMLDQWQLGDNDSSGLANFLSGVREADVVIVFAQRNNGIVDVGMRSMSEHNVADVALRLGGGGHPKAAGCTLEGDLDTVQQRVLDEVRRTISGA